MCSVIERLEGLRNVTKDIHDEQLKKVKKAFKESGHSYETVTEYGDRVANEAVIELLEGIIEMLNDEKKETETDENYSEMCGHCGDYGDIREGVIKFAHPLYPYFLCVNCKGAN